MSAPPVALIDLDGSLADYDAAMRRDYAALCGPGEYLEDLYDEKLPWVKARRDLISRQPGWWRGLARIERGFEVVDMFRDLGFRLMVCTRASKQKPDCWGEKVEWCREHLPDASVTITQDKGLVYGRVLLDDWPPYGKRWLAHRPRGLLVMVAQPWNEHAFLDDPRVIRYDGSGKDALLERLKGARDRPDGEP